MTTSVWYQGELLSDSDKAPPSAPRHSRHWLWLGRVDAWKLGEYVGGQHRQ